MLRQDAGRRVLGVKAADPKVTVVGASSFKVPLDWFEELFRLGGLKHMDAVSIHPYRAPGAPEGVALDIDGLKRLMRQYNHGRELPIWITEQGWTSAGRGGVGVSEQTQAQSTARALLEARPRASPATTGTTWSTTATGRTTRSTTSACCAARVRRPTGSTRSPPISPTPPSPAN